MRNWIYVILVIVLVGAAIDSCSCSHEKSTEEEYIEAVNNNDFKKAHEILDKLQAKYLKYPDNKQIADSYWTAADYIYKAEMQWLLPQGDVVGDERLIYTLDAMNPPGMEPVANHVYGLGENQNRKEYEAYCYFAENYNKLALELIKISMRYNNPELAEKALQSMKTCYTVKYNDYDCVYEPNNVYQERGKAILFNIKH